MGLFFVDQIEIETGDAPQEISACLPKEGIRCPTCGAPELEPTDWWKRLLARRRSLSAD